MKIFLIAGARPNFMKIAPIVQALKAKRRELSVKKPSWKIVHTGQHYDYEMSQAFFDDLEIPKPDFFLSAGSGSHAEQTARILTGVERVLVEEQPDIVLVEGDPNSVLGSALAAGKLQVKVGHVEAGLRSYDRNMPEEINRTLVDHCSHFLFAPTEKAKTILKGEGIAEEKIFVTGNTIVDAVSQNLEIAGEEGDILGSLHLNPKEYFLVTVHRQENVDNRERFASILEGLHRVAAEFKVPIIYPIHPHSRKRLTEFNLKAPQLTLIEPVDFFSFLQLGSNARLILTDSGGVQEEACILKVPCVTLRDNTERPETIEVGANILAGTSADNILECSRRILDKGNDWHNPFGDGTAGRKIVEIITGGNDG